MSTLLDVNVLIALLDTLHRFHIRAWAWFDEHCSEGWSTCPITQNGLIRILSNPSYGNSGASVTDVVGLLAAFTDVPDHKFIADDISLLNTTVIDPAALRRHKSITDTYLLALAVKNGGKLATFDRRLSTAAVSGGAEALWVIEGSVWNVAAIARPATLARSRPTTVPGPSL